MANVAAVVRPGRSPSDDRKSDKSASASSCSSQETVLGVSDTRGRQHSNQDDVSASPTLSSRLDIIGNDTGSSMDDVANVEDVFYDEQPQMELMSSPLVTRWRRTRGTINDGVRRGELPSRILCGNGNTSLSMTSSCIQSGNSPLDGYGTLRGRKLQTDNDVSVGCNQGVAASDRGRSSTSSRGAAVAGGNAVSRYFARDNFRNQNELAAVFGRKQAASGTSAVNGHASSAEPWRQQPNFAAGGNGNAEARRPLVAASSSGNTASLASRFETGNAVGNRCVVVDRNGIATYSPASSGTSGSTANKKPAVGKLSLLDRLPAFMLNSQNQQSNGGRSSSTSATAAATSPTTRTPAASAFQRTPSGVRNNAAGRNLMTSSACSTNSRQPAKFDDVDEETLSPLAAAGDCIDASRLLSASGRDKSPAQRRSTSTSRSEERLASSDDSDGRGAKLAHDFSASDRRLQSSALLQLPNSEKAAVSNNAKTTVAGRNACSSNDISTTTNTSGDCHRSTLSSYEVTDEQNYAADIRRLRQDLKWAREQVQLLTSRVSTNANVVEAFDQSLCNMASRLQRIATSNLLDAEELGDLHATICSLRRQNWSQLPPDRGPIDMSLTPAPVVPAAIGSPRTAPSSSCSSSLPAAGRHWQPSQQHSNFVGTAGVGARDHLRRQTSAESVSSVASGSSAMSSLSVQTTCGVEPADHKHKTVRNWLRSSFGKAFSRRSKSRDATGLMSRSTVVTGSGTNFVNGFSGGNGSAAGGTHSGSMPTIADPMLHYQGLRRVSASDRQGSASSIGSAEYRQQMSYPEIVNRTPAHLDAVNFTRGSQTRSSNTSLTSLPLRSITSSSKPICDVIGNDSATPGGENFREHRRSESADQKLLSTKITASIDPFHSAHHDVVVAAAMTQTMPTASGRHLSVCVLVTSPGNSDVVRPQVKELPIGSVVVNTSTTWQQLDCLIRRTFQDYLIKLDPATSIGLSGESVQGYRVGEVMRRKDTEQPELLPVGYIVGEVNNISITLKGSSENAVDQLAFELLVPKLILQRYVSLLIEHRRVILSGSAGTGKTYLAQRLAEFVVERTGFELTADSVAVFQVDNQSSRELRHYLTNIAGQCAAAAASTTTANNGAVNAGGLPRVVILDNLHRVTSLSDVFNGLLNVPLQTCPYVIGTMNQTASCSAADLQMHHNFRWVLYANHIEPVRSFLGRYLRRQLLATAAAAATSGNAAATATSAPPRGVPNSRPGAMNDHSQSAGTQNAAAADAADLARVVEWLPKVWQRINHFLETNTSCDITIGPRLFLSCPMDYIQAEVWFADLWNYSIVPYLLEAVRDGFQSYSCRGQWEELADWVTDSYPWKSRQHQQSSAGHTLYHQRPQQHPQSIFTSPDTSSGRLLSSLSTGKNAGSGGSTSHCRPSSSTAVPLLRLRPEDLGYPANMTSLPEGTASMGGSVGIGTAGHNGRKTPLLRPPDMTGNSIDRLEDLDDEDPLTDMLARLQEAALRYSDHDSDSVSSETTMAIT